MTTAPLLLTPTLAPPGYRWPLRRHVESCGRKEQYPTLEAAQAVLDSWRGALGWRWLFMQVYECTACWGYHLGRYAGVGDSQVD